MPNEQHVNARRRTRSAMLAGVAILGLLAGGSAVSLATQTPPPANAGLTTTYAYTGYADLVQAVKPAVVNVRVERDGVGRRG